MVRDVDEVDVLEAAQFAHGGVVALAAVVLDQHRVVIVTRTAALAALAHTATHTGNTAADTDIAVGTGTACCDSNKAVNTAAETNNVVETIAVDTENAIVVCLWLILSKHCRTKTDLFALQLTLSAEL